MSHWKGVKIKVWANTHTTPAHSMTPDTRGLWPPSFHDNTVGAEEKMQCTELEASIHAMQWEHGCSEVRMNNTGTPDGQGRHRRAALKEQSCPSVNNTLWSPGSRLASMRGWLYQKPVSVTLLTGSLLWQSKFVKLWEMPFSHTYKNQCFWQTPWYYMMYQTILFPRKNLHVIHPSCVTDEFW